MKDDTAAVRAALAAGDADTQAGVDVAAVRMRARGIRRRRAAVAAAATAVVAALVVTVPATLLRLSPDRPPAAGERALSCPDSLPDPPENTGPGLADALVPFAARAGLVCTYPEGGGPLTGVARLTAADLDGLLVPLGVPQPSRTPPICTDEYGLPLAVRVAGAERAVTLRLEPYGCGIVTNGVLELDAFRLKQDMRDLGDRTRQGCPLRLEGDPAVPPGSEAPGATFLPEDTRRLLVCRYDPLTDGRQPRGKPPAWDAILSPERTSRVVAELNGSPPPDPDAACATDLGLKLLLFAVTPDGVVTAVADTAGCRVIDNGERQVVNEAVLHELTG